LSIFTKYGVSTIINVTGSSTRVGGSIMRPEVVAAMAEASTESVNMVELQAAASIVIANLTGAESGYVTSGAAAGLTLGASAIMAGFDLLTMDRLPDSDGIRNEFIISREHRNGYDHALRASGAVLAEVGMNEQLAGAGVRRTESWEYEAAITENTAGIFYSVTSSSRPPLEEILTIAHSYECPVLVDAAAQLPPASNLRHFIDVGADLVVFSGGKALKGPQSAGIICGKRDLIASVALQNLDMDEHFEFWDPPDNLIPKSSLKGLPRHGIGRGFKVSKETIIGLLEALDLFSAENNVKESLEQQEYLEYLADNLSDLPINTQIVMGEQESYPMLHINLDSEISNRSSHKINIELKRGDPRIFVNEELLDENTLVIHPINLNKPLTESLAQRLRDVFK